MYEILNSRRKAGAELGMKLIAGFEMMTKNPMAVQTKVLLELLEENKNTEYGKKYGFGEIKSIEEYQAKVPVTEYDDYAEYIDIMEIDRVPQELTVDKIYAALEKYLAEVNPSYGDKVKNGLIKPLKILFSQPETYVLYKEMMLMKGNAIAQLKPVTVIGNELQKRFFFRLVDDFEEVKALSAHR